MQLFRLGDAALFQPDSLSWVMAALILFVTANVVAFSSRFLAGDRQQSWHRVNVVLLAACVLGMVFANHLLVLLGAWTASNLLLVRLMIHKAGWIAARNAGMLALKTFGVGVVLLGVGFGLLAESTGSASISVIVRSAGSLATMGFVGLAIVAVAAMTQCAAWPFHRWLTSSLNSPTPVSALMHAGVINGGGFLLARFAPLYLNEPALLHGLFMAGLVTAVVGTFWKLLQTDIKRMLACSTMGQMGFMLMQCGMGLFAPAVSHLCWHGLFKAYLFLSAGSAVKERRDTILNTNLSPTRILAAGFAGVCGAMMFALASGMKFELGDTRCLMIALAFMAATQLAAEVISKALTLARLLGTFLVGLLAGGLYGLNVRLVEAALAPLQITQPQPMNAIYFAGFFLIFLVWIGMLLNAQIPIQSQAWWKRLYLTALNASQPDARTITATRTAYKS